MKGKLPCLSLPKGRQSESPIPATKHDFYSSTVVFINSIHDPRDSLIFILVVIMLFGRLQYQCKILFQVKMGRPVGLFKGLITK